MQHLYQRVQDKIEHRNNFMFSVNDIVTAITHLKSGGLCSDHLINGSHSLFIHLSMLFNMIINHGTVPNNLLYSNVVPIVKDKRGNLSAISNYRGIALTSSLSKLLDLLILSKYSNLLCTSDQQFGFKPKFSTSMCTIALKETVMHYLNNACPCIVPCSTHQRPLIRFITAGCFSC